MKRTFRWLLFFIGIGFILGNSFDFNMNKLFRDKTYAHATAYACKNLKTVGRSYCFDKSSINYMTIGIFEKPNDYKAYIRMKDTGSGLPLIVLKKKKNIYKEIFCKVKIKHNKYEGWVKETLLDYE